MQFDPSNAWAWILTAASAIVLLSNAAEKIGKAIAAARKPNDDQDAAIRSLELRMDSVENKLARDKDRLDAYEDGMRVTSRRCWPCSTIRWTATTLSRWRKRRTPSRNIC